MDSTLKQAIQEAYATAPVDDVILHTIELTHPAFSAPIRVVQDHANHTMTLEPGAPGNGQTVTFVAFPFDFKPPEVVAQGVPEFSVQIDNVSREIVQNIELASEDGNPIDLVYRPYLFNDKTQPQMDPPPQFVLQDIKADVFRVTATAIFKNLSQTAFPGFRYTIEQWPGLVR